LTRFSDAGHRLGDKLGPRLVDLAVQATLATRRGLADHEAAVRTASTQTLIDRAGAEVAEHYRELLGPVLREEFGPVDPAMKDHLARAVAGTDQWHSLSSLLGMGVQSALSGAISNAVAPITYRINELGPNLNADPQVWAAGVAAGYADPGTGETVARQSGLGGGNFGLMVDLAQSVPDAGTLQQLVNRGIISEEDAEYWLQRAAVPARLRGAVLELRRGILTPADAALAVLRGDMTQGQGLSVAEANGYDAGQFGTLLANTGEPLGLMQLLEAYRRGFIDQATLERGIRQSRVRDEWIPTAIDLRFEPMSTADAADAALRGHLTEAQAQEIAELNGLRPQDWPAYWANQGNPPAPEQLLELWRRGYIDQAQVETGLQQGRTRDQWIPQVLDLQYEPLSTADAIDAWLRGHITQDQAEELARENGLLPRDIPTALANAGNPLALEQLLEAYRRGFIDQAGLEKGIRESRIRDEWIPTAVQLRHSPMSTADAVDAALQGWISKDAAGVIAEQNGLEPDQFGTLFESAGEPLSRSELTELFQRGLIDADRMTQGLRESRLRDAWIPDALKLNTRLPQEYQLVRLLEQGVITPEQLREQLEHLGYTAQVAGWMVTDAQLQATGRTRQLAQAQISNLYEAQIIDRGEAEQLLTQLHYSAANASLILTLADHQRRMAILTSGLTGIRSQYLAHKIDQVQARADLIALELPSSAVDLYMKTWDIERAALTRQLTEAQIYKAFTKSLFDPKDPKCNRQLAHERLTAMGYSSGDADLLLEGA
jgi:hypothetical protein